MKNADFYSSIGLFVKKNFLDHDLCQEIRVEMSAPGGNPAHYLRKDKNYLDESIRRTIEKHVSRETTDLIREKLSTVKDELEAFFGVALTRSQGAKFLYYREGDFFQRHYDSGVSPENPQAARDRKVSTVIFLNSETDEPETDSYVGGSLVLYGVMKDPRLKSHGFRLIGAQGMLVAFRSDVLHEVKAVKHGLRFTAVDWFV